MEPFTNITLPLMLMQMLMWQLSQLEEIGKEFLSFRWSSAAQMTRPDVNLAGRLAGSISHDHEPCWQPAMGGLGHCAHQSKCTIASAGAGG